LQRGDQFTEPLWIRFGIVVQHGDVFGASTFDPRIAGAAEALVLGQSNEVGVLEMFSHEIDRTIRRAIVYDYHLKVGIGLSVQGRQASR